MLCIFHRLSQLGAFSIIDFSFGLGARIFTRMPLQLKKVIGSNGL